MATEDKYDISMVRIDDLVTMRKAIFEPIKVLNEGSITKLLRTHGQAMMFQEMLKRELDSYAVILKEWDIENNTTLNNKIDQSIIKYNNFMLNLSNNSSTNDNDIIFLLRIHMIHPIKYIEDCLIVYESVCCPKNCISISMRVPSQNVDIQLFKDAAVQTKQGQDAQKFTDFNFAASIKKNIRFMKMLIKNLQKSDIDEAFVDRYRTFLRHHADLKANHELHLSPTVPQDFAWHSHMLFPDCYVRECKANTYIGMDEYIVLDHNDLMDENLIQMRKSFCDQYWKVLLYTTKKDYLNPNYKDQLLEHLIEAQVDKEKKEKLVYGFVDFKIREIVTLCFEYYFEKMERPKDVKPPSPKYPSYSRDYAYSLNYGC